MNGNLQHYRRRVDELNGQLQEARGSLERNTVKVRQLTREVKLVEEAQAVIQEVAQLTQAELEYHISELVTLALASVFDKPYEFEADFVQRRNKTECDLWFVRNENRIDPLSSSGGGAVDVACFALRLSLWSLRAQRTRNVLILDEPLKWLKGKPLPARGAAMIQEIGSRLGLQIIMNSHVIDQIESADAVFELTLKKDISYVEHLS